MSNDYEPSSRGKNSIQDLTINSGLFQAFVKCPTKCYLLSAGERPLGNVYADWFLKESESYRNAGLEQLRARAGLDPAQVALPNGANVNTTTWRLAMGFVARAQNLESTLHAVERVSQQGPGRPEQLVPIRFVPNNKVTLHDRLSLAFDALVLSEMSHREVDVGYIIHGEGPSTLKFKPLALAAEVRKLLRQIATMLSTPSPPDLILNRHCAECQFRDQCRRKAVEKDDLSLLSHLTQRERKKLNDKGIFTVTQLSYTYRPRRRPKWLAAKREKYHHALKALAIRTHKTHIVGSPNVRPEGTPVYLDVEGLPDRDFYYLIGLRATTDQGVGLHSLWADNPDEERCIWLAFLGILAQIENPVLVHYGSYEATFLKRMWTRYGVPRGIPPSVSAALRRPWNLLAAIYGRMYLPTYSNGLKEAAAFVGARWHYRDASGIQTIPWRRDWERTRSGTLKDRLLTYNQDDCTALERLRTELEVLSRESDRRPDVGFADDAQASATPLGAELHRALDGVLKSAHAAYAQRRIKLSHGAKEPDGRASKQKRRPRTLPSARGRVIRVPRKRKCPRHRTRVSLLQPARKDSEHKLLDLVFTKAGCRKTTITYVGKRAYCRVCHSTYPPPAIKRMRGQVFGRGFHSWVIYQRVALRLSYRLIEKAARDLVHEDLPSATMVAFFVQGSTRYARTEDRLLQRILRSPAIHVDETQISILGNRQYVWVLTDGNRVVFRLTEGRETDFLKRLLATYGGVLVSDFYGGYDAMPCRQQKCLVHLIRDVNDDLWKNPFDSEYEQFVACVRDLLVPMLHDVRKYGLRARHLRKHRSRVDRFYRDRIEDHAAGGDAVERYQKRFERYRESLFRFLSEDDVPWNNNAAERALRHLAVQRKISGAFSSKGADHYLRLLGVAQTCRFQAKSFLGFLLSGAIDVDQYATRPGRRGRRGASNEQPEG